MFESILQSILLSYFGEYISNLDNLSFGLFSGEIILNNLNLKLSALDELKLPLSIKHGYIKNLNIKVPLNPWVSNVKINIDGIYILCVLRELNNNIFNNNNDNNLENSIKRKKLLHMETIKKLNDNKSDMSITSKLISHVLTNLEISITNIHIRYEDVLSLNHPFSFGIMLKEILIQTSDIYGNVSINYPDNTMFKLIRLHNLSFYWNTKSDELVISLPYEKMQEWFDNSFKVAISLFDFIILPFSSSLRLTWNRQMDFKSPKYSISLELDTFQCNLNIDQCSDIIKINDSFNEFNMRSKIISIYKTIGFDRPVRYPFKARDWWIWTVYSINKLKKCKDLTWRNNLTYFKSNKNLYIKTYKKILHNSLATTNIKINDDELKINLNFEENIFTFEQILIFREIAWEEVKTEKDKQNSVGYLASFWNSTVSHLSENDKLQLTRSIDFDLKLKSLTIPDEYIQVSFNLVISSFSFNFLVPNICHIIIQTSVNSDFTICEKYWQLRFKIFDVLIKDESIILCKATKPFCDFELVKFTNPELGILIKFDISQFMLNLSKSLFHFFKDNISAIILQNNIELNDKADFLQQFVPKIKKVSISGKIDGFSCSYMIDNNTSFYFAIGLVNLQPFINNRIVSMFNDCNDNSFFINFTHLSFGFIKGCDIPIISNLSTQIVFDPKKFLCSFYFPLINIELSSTRICLLNLLFDCFKIKHSYASINISQLNPKHFDSSPNFKLNLAYAVELFQCTWSHDINLFREILEITVLNIKLGISLNNSSIDSLQLKIKDILIEDRYFHNSNTRLILSTGVSSFIPQLSVPSLNNVPSYCHSNIKLFDCKFDYSEFKKSHICLNSCSHEVLTLSLNELNEIHLKIGYFHFQWNPETFNAFFNSISYIIDYAALPTAPDEFFDFDDQLDRSNSDTIDFKRSVTTFFFNIDCFTIILNKDHSDMHFIYLYFSKISLSMINSTIKGNIMDLQLWKVENNLSFRQQVSKRSYLDGNVTLVNNNDTKCLHALNFNIQEKKINLKINSLCIAYHNSTIMELVDYTFSGIFMPLKALFKSNAKNSLSSVLSREDMILHVKDAFYLEAMAFNILTLIPCKHSPDFEDYLLADISQITYTFSSNIVDEKIVARSNIDFNSLKLFARFFENNSSLKHNDILITNAQSGLELGFIHPTVYSDGRRMHCYMDLREFVGNATPQLYKIVLSALFNNILSPYPVISLPVKSEFSLTYNFNLPSFLNVLFTLKASTVKLSIWNRFFENSPTDLICTLICNNFDFSMYTLCNISRKMVLRLTSLIILDGIFNESPLLNHIISSFATFGFDLKHLCVSNNSIEFEYLDTSELSKLGFKINRICGFIKPRIIKQFCDFFNIDLKKSFTKPSGASKYINFEVEFSECFILQDCTPYNKEWLLINSDGKFVYSNKNNDTSAVFTNYLNIMIGSIGSFKEIVSLINSNWFYNNFIAIIEKNNTHTLLIESVSIYSPSCINSVVEVVNQWMVLFSNQENINISYSNQENIVFWPDVSISIKKFKALTELDLHYVAQNSFLLICNGRLNKFYSHQFNICSQNSNIASISSNSDSIPCLNFEGNKLVLDQIEISMCESNLNILKKNLDWIFGFSYKNSNHSLNEFSLAIRESNISCYNSNGINFAQIIFSSFSYNFNGSTYIIALECMKWRDLSFESNHVDIFTSLENRFFDIRINKEILCFNIYSFKSTYQPQIYLKLASLLSNLITIVTSYQSSLTRTDMKELKINLSRPTLILPLDNGNSVFINLDQLTYTVKDNLLTFNLENLSLIENNFYLLPNYSFCFDNNLLSSYFEFELPNIKILLSRTFYRYLHQVSNSITEILSLFRSASLIKDTSVKSFTIKMDSLELILLDQNNVSHVFIILKSFHCSSQPFYIKTEDFLVSTEDTPSLVKVYTGHTIETPRNKKSYSPSPDGECSIKLDSINNNTVMSITVCNLYLNVVLSDFLWVSKFFRLKKLPIDSPTSYSTASDFNFLVNLAILDSRVLLIDKNAPTCNGVLASFSFTMSNIILPKKSSKLQLLEFEAYIVSLNGMKINKPLDVLNYADFVKFGHPLVKPYAAALEFFEEIENNDCVRDIVFTSDSISINASFIDYYICNSLFDQVAELFSGKNKEVRELEENDDLKLPTEPPSLLAQWSSAPISSNSNIINFLTINLQGLSLTFIQDCVGFLPIFKILISNNKLLMNGKNGNYSGDVEFALSGDYYNSRVLTWEPLVELTKCELSVFQIDVNDAMKLKCAPLTISLTVSNSLALNLSFNFLHEIISTLKAEMILSKYTPYYLHNDIGISIIYSLIGNENQLVVGEVKPGERTVLDVSVFNINYIEEGNCPFKIEFRMCGFEPLPLLDPNHCGASWRQTKQCIGRNREEKIDYEYINYDDEYDIIITISTDDHSRLISVSNPYLIENNTQLPLLLLFESPDDKETVEIGPVDAGKSMSIPILQSFWYMRSVKPYFTSDMYNWSVDNITLKNLIHVKKPIFTDCSFGLKFPNSGENSAFCCHVEAIKPISTTQLPWSHAALDASWKIIFHAPLQLCNSLPRRIHYLIRQRGIILDRGIVGPGLDIKIHSVSYVLKPEIMIKLDGFEWSQWFHFGPSYEDCSNIHLQDPTGSILSLQFDQLDSPGNGCILSIWCEYCSTNLDFIFGFPSNNSDNIDGVSQLPGQLSKVTVECFENQRYSLLSGFQAPYLITDRNEFTDESGNITRNFHDFILPAGWVWTSDWRILTTNDTDHEGWGYSFDFSGPFERSSVGMYCRRRVWIRERIPVGVKFHNGLILHGGEDNICLIMSRTARSNPFNVNENSSDGVVVIKDLINPLNQFSFGISFSISPFHTSTKIVTISHRYILVNSTSYNLKIRQFKSNNSLFKPVDLLSNAQLPWHFKDLDSSHNICVGVEESHYSGPICATDMGEVLVKLFKRNSKDFFILRATLQLNSATIYITFSFQDEIYPIYKIINNSGFEVFFQQILPGQNYKSDVFNDKKWPWSSVADRETCLWAWEEVAISHYICVIINNVPVIVPFDKLGYKKEIKNWGIITHIVQVYSDGPTKVLKIEIASDSFIENPISTEIPEIEQLQFELLLPVLSISFVDDSPQEFLYCHINEIATVISFSNLFRKISLNISNIQVDNLLEEAIYPLLLRSKSPSITEVNKTPLPFISMYIVKAYNKNIINYYKYFALLVQALNFEVDESLLRLIQKMNKKIEGIFEADELIMRKTVNKYLCLADSNYQASAPLSPNMVSVTRKSSKLNAFFTNSIVNSLVSRKKRNSLLVNAPERPHLLYFDYFEISTLDVTLSFKLQSTISDSKDPYELFVRSIGLVLVNVDGAKLTLLGKKANNFGVVSRNDLKIMMIEHYKSVARSQVFNIIGSSAIIGNPVSFIRNIGEGVDDFVSEPSKGFARSPEEFGVGILKGGKSLLKNTVFGFIGTVGAITSSVASGAVALTADDSYINNRTMIQRKYSGNLAVGMLTAGSGFVNAVEGLYEHPSKGLENDGALGFVKGLGKGFVGLFVKPLVGIYDAAASLSSAIKNADSKEIKPKQLRLPRCIYGISQTIRPYSLEDAIIYGVWNSRMKLDNESFESYFYLLNQCIVILSSSSLYVYDRNAEGVLYAAKWKKIVLCRSVKNDIIILFKNGGERRLVFAYDTREIINIFEKLVFLYSEMQFK